MSNAYSIDLRTREVEYVEEGGSKTEAWRLLKVGRDTIYRWLKQKKDQGTLHPKPVERRGGYKLKDAILERHVQANPDQTSGEMAEALSVHSTTVHYGCKRLKISRKKNHTVQRARRKSQADIPGGIGKNPF